MKAAIQVFVVIVVGFITYGICILFGASDFYTGYFVGSVSQILGYIITDAIDVKLIIKEKKS